MKATNKANQIINNNKYNTMKKNKTQKCSICGQEIKGFGRNAYPVTDGRCCNSCHGSIVMQARAASADLSTVNEREVIEFSSRRFKGVAFDYVKSLQVLTDYKGIYIKNYPAEELNKAVQIFDELYLNFTSLTCDYSNVGKHMEQLTEVDILKELEFEDEECDGTENFCLTL